jgi:hypothetical protein
MAIRVVSGLLGLFMLFTPIHMLVAGIDVPPIIFLGVFLGIAFLVYSVGGQKILRKL